MCNFIYKAFIKISALSIKDKEERARWRYNKLHHKIKRLPGHSYICMPSTVNAEIGKFVSIAENALIGSGQHTITGLSSSPVFYEKGSAEINKLNPPCIIGNDVWIGRNVFIKPGIVIGTGAVIGCNSVVTKDVPDYAVVGGVPAKVIKYRFKEDVIKALLSSKWWDLPLDELKKMHYDDVDLFLKELHHKTKKTG